MEAVPKDTEGAIPTPERIFGSLPTTDLQAVTVPGLRDDLMLSQAAWQQGKLRHRVSASPQALTLLGVLVASAVVLWLLRVRRRRRDT